MNNTYRTIVVAIFASLGLILITFLLMISKKGGSIIENLLPPVQINPVQTNPTVQIIPGNTNVPVQIIPGQTNIPVQIISVQNVPVTPTPIITGLEDITPIQVGLANGVYELTSAARNIVLEASPINSPLFIVINYVPNSAGRLISIRNVRSTSGTPSNIVVGTRGGLFVGATSVTIEGGPFTLVPGTQIFLRAIRDNYYTRVFSRN